MNAKVWSTSVLLTVAPGQAQRSCLGYTGVSALNSNVPLLWHGCCPAPYCNRADMEQWLFNAFLVISTTPFWQEQVKHHSRTASSHDQVPSLPCSSQECNFWLQATEDVKPAHLHLPPHPGRQEMPFLCYIYHAKFDEWQPCSISYLHQSGRITPTCHPVPFDGSHCTTEPPILRDHFELDKLPDSKLTPDILKNFTLYRLKQWKPIGYIWLLEINSLLAIIHHISNYLATVRENLKRCFNYKAE